ncbi:hypothetical protein P1J78_03150 [Psychromarinibacter sp. C21-152]|uniref:Uncharacterized protein n=1 Tax=Psychromarinibacter sediminicola TaxID=3033385 RepID=A0AAE3T6X3_9RHOB|nr:hypothetical protein [Psychromarinibacter sediminicola]MDF0599722.1 hypothetical protein [Psychromarinibacter sediminicola]
MTVLTSPASLSPGHRKSVGELPIFEPMAGTVIAEPPGNEEGYWVGGPSPVFDENSQKLYLSIRRRTKLLEHGRAGRGGETAILESADGETYSEVWKADKSAFEALSIEKSCLVQTSDGRFRLYVSYTAIFDYRWRIAMIEADTPANLDPATAKVVLTSEMTGTEGVKDPVIYNVGGLWHMFANCCPTPEAGDPGRLNRMHKEGNAFVSGEMPCPSGLATSHDGINWNWQGVVLPTGDGWDRYLARFTSLIHTPPFFTCIYDGRPNIGPAYCENPGLAISFDLRTFHKLGHERGILRSPHGRGGLRYVEALIVGTDLFYFYEIARPDFAHELRTIRMPLGAGGLSI